MLAMRLFYNQRAPADYQAPVFRATKENEVLVMRSKPQEKSIGSLFTPRHKSDFLVPLPDEDLDDSDSAVDADDIFVDRPEPAPFKQNLRKSRLKKKTVEFRVDDMLGNKSPEKVGNEMDEMDSLFIDDAQPQDIPGKQSAKKPEGYCRKGD